MNEEEVKQKLKRKESKLVKECVMVNVENEASFFFVWHEIGIKWIA